MTQPDKDKKVKALIEKAVKHIVDKEDDQAEPLIKEILELDPESLDGHILATRFGPHLSDEVYNHLKFVMDRNIKHESPRELGYKTQEHIEHFLSLLKVKSYRCKEDSEKYDEIIKEIIYYFSKALAANIRIPEIYEFVEVLLEDSRFDDVINIGFVLTGDKKGNDIGWPGLDYSKKYKDIDSVCLLVMHAFHESKRYVDGCRWIQKCLVENQKNHFMWYLLGETLAWLGYPEETSRAWIIAIEKGNFIISERETFETLAKLVCDKGYAEKISLFEQFFRLKDKISPELLGAYEEIYRSFNYSFGSPEQPAPSKKYIEDKLGIKMEEGDTPKRYRFLRRERLHFSSVKSKDPVIKEAIDFIDKYIDSGYVKIDDTISTVKQAQPRVKVTAGGPNSLEQQNITLTQFGINITEQVHKGEIQPIIGRDREIDRMIRILARSEKNNPVLLGEAGVGKTAAVYGLAQRIVTDNVPDALKNKIIIELNVGALVAGTTYRGDFEQRMNNIIKEMRGNPDIVLFIDEFHMLIGAGDSKGQMDASNILKPALSSGEIRLIGATTSREYSKSIERDAAFERRFSPVYLNEISHQITFSVLKARVSNWQKHHHVEIHDDVLHDAIQLTDQHIKHRHFPDKAIDLIDEACALARMGAITDKDTKVVLKPEHIKKICDQWTGASAVKGIVPANYIGNIEEQLREHVVGHDELLEELSIVVTDEKLGLYTSKLPRVLYFYGFPDTGKTECAQALSRVLWPGEKERFLYIDMELFKDPSDLNRLMGAPRGSIGSEEGGRLAIHLNRNPYTLIYLYNFHKAHERIIRFFSNLFREGLFSDGAGRTIYAGNAIFILSATVTGNGQKIGYTKGHDEVKHTLLSENSSIPGILHGLNLSKEIFHFIKGYYFFNELNETELRELISRKIKTIKNQPGIRELDPKIDENILEDIVQEYVNQAYASRSLRGLFQKYVYPAIGL